MWRARLADAVPRELIVCRHGNTFDPGDVVLRCGARTDLPLSQSGREQARQLGKSMRQRFPRGFRAVWVSRLRRTHETATELLCSADFDALPQADGRFDEIDYGPDEGRPEQEVRARIGEVALAAWEEKGEPPEGWLIDPDALIHRWRGFLAELEAAPCGGALVVTSNGIARFLWPALGRPVGGGRLRTGAFGRVLHTATGWQIEEWDERPPEGA